MWLCLCFILSFCQVIKQKLLSICDKIGLLKSLCRKFVRGHLGVLIEELTTSDDVTTICVNAKACTWVYHAHSWWRTVSSHASPDKYLIGSPANLAVLTQTVTGYNSHNYAPILRLQRWVDTCTFVWLEVVCIFFYSHQIVFTFICLLFSLGQRSWRSSFKVISGHRWKWASMPDSDPHELMCLLPCNGKTANMAINFQALQKNALCVSLSTGK